MKEEKCKKVKSDVGCPICGAEIRHWRFAKNETIEDKVGLKTLFKFSKMIVNLYRFDIRKIRKDKLKSKLTNQRA